MFLPTYLVKDCNTLKTIFILGTRYRVQERLIERLIPQSTSSNTHNLRNGVELRSSCRYFLLVQLSEITILFCYIVY
jgi:hypothetical protein